MAASRALNEALQTGELDLFHVDSDDNTADLSAKGLGGENRKNSCKSLATLNSSHHSSQRQSQNSNMPLA